NRCMLDGGNEKLAGASLRTSRSEGQDVGFRTAYCKVILPRLLGHQRGHAFPSFLDQPTGGSAFGMNRGRIANHVQRRDNRGARLRPKRWSISPRDIQKIAY